VTSTVTKLTAQVIDSKSGAVGIVAIVLLIVLLIQYEMVQTVGSSHRPERRATYRIAIAPLLVVFAVVVTTRLAEVIHFS
jgi:hypothetical protein